MSFNFLSLTVEKIHFIMVIYIFLDFCFQNMKVHENRRQMFSSSATKEASNPFMRQRPLASRNTASTSASPPPWANDSPSSSQLFPR